MADTGWNYLLHQLSVPTIIITPTFIFMEHVLYQISGACTLHDCQKEEDPCDGCNEETDKDKDRLQPEGIGNETTHEGGAMMPLPPLMEL